LTSEVRLEDAVAVVALRGEADVFTQPVLCDVLARVIAEGAGDIVIDLTEVPFIDVATG
jgi:anti-anti-sigma factor